MASTSKAIPGVWTRGIWLPWIAHAINTKVESCESSHKEIIWQEKYFMVVFGQFSINLKEKIEHKKKTQYG